GAPHLGADHRRADHWWVAVRQGRPAHAGIYAPRPRRTDQRMTRRVPVLASLVVAAAVAVLIGLGVWQLQRAKWKEGLLARYEQAEKLPPITWPTIPLKNDQLPLFRHATAMCLKPVGKRAIGGENRQGDPG